MESLKQLNVMSKSVEDLEESLEPLDEYLGESCNSSYEDRKLPKIGNEFQVTELPIVGNEYDEIEKCELVFDPKRLPDTKFDDYVQKCAEASSQQSQSEQFFREALEILSKNGYDVDKAFEVYLATPKKEGFAESWTEEDCKKFESGLYRKRKRFFQIHKHYLKGKQTKEIVQFYYLWKKSRRYQIFKQKISIKAREFQPGAHYVFGSVIPEEEQECSHVSQVFRDQCLFQYIEKLQKEEL